MKSFFKKLAFVMALAMVVSLAAPAAKPAFAATEFTYAEQESGAKITTLNLKIGEEVDLKFKGVADYKSYPLKWVSADEEVATVDQRGVVTAVANGTTTVELQVGDGTVYTSEKVVVNVAAADAYDAYPVELGTAKDNTFLTYEMTTEESVDLNFYGVKDWAAGRFTCKWSSLVKGVATVDQKGVVTPVAPGTTVVAVTIIDNVVGTEYVGSVFVTVSEPVVPTEEPTSTPEEPTDTPEEPTGTPEEPTGTPEEPVVEDTYTVVQVSDTTAKLVFNKAVNYTKDDIELYWVLDSASGPIDQSWYIKSIEYNTEKTELSFVPYVPFEDGYKYIVKVNGEEEGTPFTASVGDVKSIEAGYKCNGKEDTAYTNGEDGDLIDVEVTYTLYDAKKVNVTNHGTNKDNVMFSLAEDYDFVDIDNTTGKLNFRKAGLARVIVTYTYVDENGEEQTIDSEPLPVVCQPAPAYEIVSVDTWTIAKNGTKAKDVPDSKHSVAAYDSNYRVIVYITDNYGNTFVNYKPIADAKSDDKVFWTEDENAEFAKRGYSIKFVSTDPDRILIDTEGVLETYTNTKAYVFVQLCNSELEGDSDFVKNLTALQIEVTGERAVKTVVADSSITLITDAETVNKDQSGTQLYEGKIYITIKDQYTDPWGGATAWEVTTTDKELENTHGLFVDTDEDGNYYISIDAKDLKANNGNKNGTVTFKVTEKISGKSDTFSVIMKDPTYVKDDKGNPTSAIKVDGWKLDVAASVDQKISKEADGTTKTADIFLYKTSGTTSTLVGLYNDLTICGEKAPTDMKLTKDTTKIGDRYLVVYNPDNKIVPSIATASGTAICVQKNADYDKYEVVVAAKTESGEMEYAKEGRYKVVAFEVTGYTTKGEAKFKTTTSSFTVNNSSADVTLKNRKDVDTTATNIRDLVVDAFSYKLDGNDWNTVSADMVAKVTGIDRGSYVVITSVTFNVPLNGDDDDAYYVKTVSGINLSIEVPAEFDATGLERR